MPPKRKGATTPEEVPSTPPPPTSGTGKFYYPAPSKATYTGDWKLLFPAEPVNLEPEKKGAKKPKPDEMPEPVEPPRRVRHGRGTYREGAYVYEGDFHEDAITGQGKFTYESGACYEGQWEAGVYQGHGKFTWPDGRSYEGEWVQNKMHGKGKYTDTNGHTWHGQFYNGAGPGLTYILQ